MGFGVGVVVGTGEGVGDGVGMSVGVAVGVGVTVGVFSIVGVGLISLVNDTALERTLGSSSGVGRILDNPTEVTPRLARKTPMTKKAFTGVDYTKLRRFYLERND